MIDISLLCRCVSRISREISCRRSNFCLGKMGANGRLAGFLGKKARQRGGVITRPHDLQISDVLPISSGDFAEMLNRLQRQSNMVVRRTEPTWTVQKVGDLGSTSSFMARVLIGVMRLRNIIYRRPKGARQI